MGGSTNTILHTLAAAQEGEVDFTLEDINEISYRVPCLSKVAPNGTYHIEDVHRAGGIPAILGELRRAGHLSLKVHTALYDNAEQWLDDWDIRNDKALDKARELFYAAPGGVRTTKPFSQSNRWESLDTDQANGCIHDAEYAYSSDGGLVVLRGNLATNGAIVKAAGVEEELWKFSGPARVVESQEEAVSIILRREIKAGDVIVIRYEGPSGGPGMQEMLHPTSFLKGSGLGKACALITDGRFLAAPPDSPSDTSPRRPHTVDSSAWSKMAIRFPSTSTRASSPWTLMRQKLSAVAKRSCPAKNPGRPSPAIAP